MLNTLVNSTGEGLCNPTSAYYKQSCIDEIFECIGTVACQTDMNTEALEQIHDNLQTTNVSATNVSADSVCTNSVCTNAISTVGIEANNVQSQCMNVEGKATVGSLESNGAVKAESVETQSLSTENITGLQSLTVDGCVWADAVDTDALKVNGKAVAECIESDEISTESLKSDTISTSTIGADTVVSDCFMGANANIQKACIGSLSTSCFSSDEIATSKINSTSLSIPKAETSGGITGKGTIDTTSPVWKEIKIPLFTGTVQFYTDEWKVTINGGREFIWEDPSLDHLKFLSNDGETVTVAVDWDGDVYYTYNVAKEEPVLSFTDNTGHTPDDDHTYIMQDSGIPRGTVYIYQDKEFTNQGLTILGKVKASNLEITCGESIDCLSVGNLCVGNSIISDRPIEVNICARSFCVSSPCTYIDNCLYADHLETHCICNDGYLHTKRLYFDHIQMVHCTEKPKSVVVYEDGLLCDSYKVCVDDDTVYSQKSCACDFYGNLHGKANDTCCFDGRLFCDACFEILSGKACTAGLADNSCCFDGRTFSNACLEILSGKACTAGMADCAKNVCIWCLWAGTEPDWGYIPFTDPYTGCLVQARIDTGYSNPMVAYNEYGLVCLEIRGCVCVNDDPLIANYSIATRYLKADDMRVCEDALITNLCSCNSYTKRLCVNNCAKFQGPVYFYDNIYQCGKAYCTHAQNIYTCSDTITMREGANFAGEAQIKVLKYDGTNNGIIQLGTDGTLRIGDETNCQPVLTRSEEADICDGHVLVWDATARCAKDGGDAIVTCDYVHCVGKECAKASCDYACIVGTQCKTAACSFAVSCGHSIGTACKNAATSTKANCYGKSYNCVQCSELARQVILGTYTAPQKRFVYFGNPADATPIGCNPNLWYCPTCSILAMTGYDKTGSTLCLVGKGSCCMSGICSKENPKIVFSDTAGYCGCLQLSRYTDTVHPGYGLCWMTNYPLDSWIQTDCFYANRYLDKNGCQLGGYCASIASSNGTTRYVLLDLSKADAMVDFQVYNNNGTIVKTPGGDSPVGNVNQLTNYGLTGYASIGTNSSPSTCFWLRTASWRPLYFWGSAPIKIVSNTTTDPGCTWNSPTILPTCGYVTTIGSQCKSAACTYASSVGEQCKSAACTYASSVGEQCKSAACTYANTVAFCNVNTCKGIGVMGVARCIDAQCWTKAGYWAYMTTKDGPNCCWNHVIKTDWSTGVDTWNSGISIPTYCAPKSGIHYKTGCCSGTVGWRLVPDIICVQDLGLSCRSIAEACACAFTASCGHEIGTSCKNAATATKANCYGNSNNCVQCSELARQVILGTYTAPQKRFIYVGDPAAAKNIGCNANLWFCPTCNIMVMGDANGSALCLIGTGSCCVGGVCSKLNPKIVFASIDNQCGCLQYTQYDVVHPGAGLCWITNQPNTWFQTDCVYANKYLDASGVALPTCGYVSAVGGQCKSASCSFAVSCGHEIGTSCRNLAEACACAFAATCAQSVVPETSTFAKCYGNSTNCVAYANQVRVGVASGNAFYKMPFTGSTGTTTSNQSLYIDNANAYPSYNPSTNVFCGYTVCVAQTLAVRNANGGFRLGNYCIYIA